MSSFYVPLNLSLLELVNYSLFLKQKVMDLLPHLLLNLDYFLLKQLR